LLDEVRRDDDDDIIEVVELRCNIKSIALVGLAGTGEDVPCRPKVKLLLPAEDVDWLSSSHRRFGQCVDKTTLPVERIIACF
jgi:hypothetical protein